MNERLKQLRKNLGLTLEKFGDKIGVKKNTMSQWERGINEISNQSIKAICREFNVNEEWLRSGNGNMFNDVDTDTMTKIDYLMTGENETAKELFKRFANLDEEEWKALKKIIDKLKRE